MAPPNNAATLSGVDGVVPFVKPEITAVSKSQQQHLPDRLTSNAAYSVPFQLDQVTLSAVAKALIPGSLPSAHRQQRQQLLFSSQQHACSVPTAPSRITTAPS
jgi:hypothetical protein